ncbi:MAG: hypothetical protein EFT35_03315 [Methanophagales archaeon ANME-1-THS]|nr:MAG: hypothetical protein EFT35_03315 [Methanophagales archaeon ANME-1-THS]
MNVLSSIVLFIHKIVTTMVDTMILGLDVGGANTKAANSDRSFVRLIYAPLYRNKAILHGVLADVKRALEAERKGIEAVGAVVTDEICGCFNTKKEGVLCIKNTVSSIFSDVHFFDKDCRFKDGSSVDKDPVSSPRPTGWHLHGSYLKNTKTRFSLISEAPQQT